MTLKFVACTNHTLLHTRVICFPWHEKWWDFT